ncbi:MAG TPA: hypothetical protein VF310_09300 [Vicinamibacteria bacterium]
MADFRQSSRESAKIPARMGRVARTAAHVALAVAIGALLLAVAGLLHALSTAAAVRPTWLLALVVWPAVTAIPGFLGALVAGAVLARLPRSADAR